ncbi:MAG TPA: class I SAM-dependent methyltransferase [Ktedonobacteraceae bacterium]|jgi:arsenite methyltransferase|nr:class I SAM-dependent methyltransferase [Ktedonobacteraceae bacterium]
MIRDNLFVGTFLAIQGLFLRRGAKKVASSAIPLLTLLGSLTTLVGSLMVLEGLAIVWSSKVTKPWWAKHLLNQLHLQGNERVLDVGCGRGLLLVEAAKRLPRGHAVGIDHWSQVDQSQNHREATLLNAHLEGVADRVEIHDGDMRNLPFPDACFDVVVASLSIHNIESDQGRGQAIQEIHRVLKPGGRVALMDIFHLKQMAAQARQSGLRNVKISFPFPLHYPPLRIITGKKGE